MRTEQQQWQEITGNYLKLIEANLAGIDHPQRADILSDVKEHLDNKYAELPDEQKNWEGFQQIITEMGPPEEYAELLAEEQTPARKSTSGVNTFLAIVFILVLMLVGAHLIFTAQNAATPTEPVSNRPHFELDEQVLGKWTSVDFVKTINDFNPSKQNWRDTLFLQGLDFEPSEIVIFTFMAGQRAPNRWSRGEIYYNDERPSRYDVRHINGENYLFMEWISGDVTIRGQEPYYYVLKKAE